MATTDEAYNVWAETYEDGSNPMLALSAHIIGKLTPGARVLELGCGTGRNLAMLGELGATDLLGFDSSAAMLEKATSRLPQADLRHHDLNQPLPVEDDSVDFILTCLVLEHFPEVSHMFKECARVLKPGGQFVVIELHPQVHAKGSQAHFKNPQGERVPVASWAHGLAEFERAGEDAGLTLEFAEDVYPTPELEQRFPSEKRKGEPWLLKCTWRR